MHLEVRVRVVSTACVRGITDEVLWRVKQIFGRSILRKAPPRCQSAVTEKSSKFILPHTSTRSAAVQRMCPQFILRELSCPTAVCCTSPGIQRATLSEVLRYTVLVCRHLLRRSVHNLAAHAFLHCL